jgi:hypothetical protein
MQKRDVLEIVGFALCIILIMALLYNMASTVSNNRSSSELGLGIEGSDPIQVQTTITFPNGTKLMLQHHDANKTNNGLDWLTNKTTGFGNNATLNMIYIGWSNSTANIGLTSTHLSWIFNDTAHQGNGLGRKTLTVSNRTRWSTYGKFNLTAKAYNAEVISGICKTFLAFHATSTYNCFMAVDIITPIVNLPAGSSITSTWVITFS